MPLRTCNSCRLPPVHLERIFATSIYGLRRAMEFEGEGVTVNKKLDERSSTLSHLFFSGIFYLRELATYIYIYIHTSNEAFLNPQHPANFVSKLLDRQAGPLLLCFFSTCVCVCVCVLSQANKSPLKQIQLCFTCPSKLSLLLACQVTCWKQHIEVGARWSLSKLLIVLHITFYVEQVKHLIFQRDSAFHLIFQYVAKCGFPILYLASLIARQRRHCLVRHLALVMLPVSSLLTSKASSQLLWNSVRYCSLNLNEIRLGVWDKLRVCI